MVFGGAFSSGSFGDLVFDFFNCCRLLQAGEDPEVVTEYGPAHHHFPVRKSFRARRSPHEVTDDDADSRFGSGSTFESFTHAGFVFQSGAEFGDVSWAEAASYFVFL